MWFPTDAMAGGVRFILSRERPSHSVFVARAAWLSAWRGLASAGLFRPVAAAAAIRRSQRIPQGLTGRDACHHDHAAKGDVLEKHRHALVLAIFRHHLGLGAKVGELKNWRSGHRGIIALLKTLRNRLAAGLRVWPLRKCRVSAPYKAMMPRRAAETLHFCRRILSVYGVRKKGRWTGPKTPARRGHDAGGAVTYAPLQSASRWNGARPPMLCIGKMPAINYLSCSFFRQLQPNPLSVYDSERKRPGFRSLEIRPSKVMRPRFASGRKRALKRAIKIDGSLAMTRPAAAESQDAGDAGLETIQIPRNAAVRIAGN